MHKHLKKIIAIVLVLAMAISAFVINTTAQSAISRIVRNVSIVVDLIKFQNNHWDTIGHIIDHDPDDLDRGDVESLIGGADLGDVVDVLKCLANAGIDPDDLIGIFGGLKGNCAKVSIPEFIDLICSSAKDPGCIDKDLLAEVFGFICKSEVDSLNLADIFKAIIGSVDFPDSGLDKEGFGNIFGIIIDGIKNIVDANAKCPTNPDVETPSVDVNVNDADWTGTWSTSMAKASVSLFENDIAVTLKNITARSRVKASIGGDVIRITLSNEYGTTPLKVGEVTAAIGDKNIARAINLSTLTKVTFGGKTSVTIPAGQTIKSDPIKLSVKALDDIVISAYYKEISRFSTVGLIGGHCYASLGNNTESYVTAASIDLALEKLSVGAYEIIPVLSNIDVYTAGNDDACSAVLFGDSTLTNTIPQLLAAKLQAAGIKDVGVLQQAIKGNELLRDGQGIIGGLFGEAGLKRFYKDAINQPGCKYIFVKIGVNDIVHPNCASKNDLYPDGVEYDKIIDGYKTLIDQAHENGKTIIFFTRSAWKGYTRDILGLTENDLVWTPEIDAIRLQINEWLKSSDCKADYIIDLDSLCDLTDLAALKPELTLDGAHLTPKGCQAVVDLIPLEIFGGHSGSIPGGSTGGDCPIDIDIPGCNLPKFDINDLKLIFTGLIKDKDCKIDCGTIDMDALIDLLKKIGIGGAGCPEISLPDCDNIKVVIDLVTGAIKHPGTGCEIGKINIDLIKGILDKIGFDCKGLPSIDVILDLAKGLIKLPSGDCICKLPKLDLEDLKLIFSGLIKDKDCNIDLGSIDMSALIDILKKIGGAGLPDISIPNCGDLKVIIDLVTGAIKVPGTGCEIGKINIDLIKGILDKIGCDCDGLKSIEAVIDIAKGLIKLPDFDGCIIGKLPKLDLDALKLIFSGLIKDKDCNIDLGKLDLSALIDLIKKIGIGGSNCPGIALPDCGDLKVIIDLVTGAIKVPGTGCEIGKINIDLLKKILDNIGFDCDGLKGLDAIIDFAKGLIKLPSGDIICNLPKLDLEGLKLIFSGLIKDKDCNIDLGKIDMSILVDLLKKIGNGTGCPGITLPSCDDLKVIIDLVTGSIKLPGSDCIIGKIDTGLLKDILDKIGFDCKGLPCIDAIIDLAKGMITLPTGECICKLPCIVIGGIFDRIKDFFDIFDEICPGTDGDAVPGTKDPDTDAPVKPDPAVDPHVDEVLEDVDVIDDLIIDDSTPLAGTPASDATVTGLDDTIIANTGDEGVTALITVAVAAGAIFVTSLKKKED